MLRRLLFWYLKKYPLNDIELTNLLIATVREDTSVWSRDDELELFGRLKSVDGLIPYLSSTMFRDSQRHFQAQSPTEQLTIRGGFLRTAYWKALLVKSDIRKDEKLVKMPGSRYAT